MNDADYKLAQEFLCHAANIIAVLDLDAFIGRIEQAHALGPILDPTLYKAAHNKLGDVKRLAVAARQFQAEVNRQREAATKEQTEARP